MKKKKDVGELQHVAKCGKVARRQPDFFLLILTKLNESEIYVLD